MAGEEISVEKIEVREKFSADTKKSTTSTAAGAAFLPEAMRGDPARGRGRLGAVEAAVGCGEGRGRAGYPQRQAGPQGHGASRQAKPAKRSREALEPAARRARLRGGRRSWSSRSEEPGQRGAGQASSGNGSLSPAGKPREPGLPDRCYAPTAAVARPRVPAPPFETGTAGQGTARLGSAWLGTAPGRAPPLPLSTWRLPPSLLPSLPSARAPLARFPALFKARGGHCAPFPAGLLEAYRGGSGWIRRHPRCRGRHRGAWGCRDSPGGVESCPEGRGYSRPVVTRCMPAQRPSRGAGPSAPPAAGGERCVWRLCQVLQQVKMFVFLP